MSDMSHMIEFVKTLTMPELLALSNEAIQCDDQEMIQVLSKELATRTKKSENLRTLETLPRTEV